MEIFQEDSGVSNLNDVGTFSRANDDSISGHSDGIISSISIHISDLKLELFQDFMVKYI